MYVDGMNLRRVAWHLDVNHQSIANWVNAYAARLPAAPQPEGVGILEMDEVYTFIGEKNQAFILTHVDRDTHCIVMGDWSLTGAKPSCSRWLITRPNRISPSVTPFPPYALVDTYPAQQLDAA